MFKDVMLDLETLAKGARAHIIQIAAIAFDRDTGELGARFNMYVRGAQSGRTIDPDTVAWWMQQTVAPIMGAKLADAHDTEVENLWAALCDFQEWFQAQETAAGGAGEVRVWAHGAPFDIPIVEDAFRELLETDDGPWHYRAPRDTRTLFDVAGFDVNSIPQDPDRAHDAEYDCELQIRQVCAALAKLRGIQNDAEALANMRSAYAADSSKTARELDVVADTQPGVGHTDEQGGKHSTAEAAVPAQTNAHRYPEDFSTVGENPGPF